MGTLKRGSGCQHLQGGARASAKASLEWMHQCNTCVALERHKETPSSWDGMGLSDHIALVSWWRNADLGIIPFLQRSKVAPHTPDFTPTPHLRILPRPAHELQPHWQGQGPQLPPTFSQLPPTLLFTCASCPGLPTSCSPTGRGSGLPASGQG